MLGVDAFAHLDRERNFARCCNRLLHDCREEITFPGQRRAATSTCHFRYGAAEVQIDVVSEILVHKIAHGLGNGSRVGILMTNRLEFLSSLFGTALAGGVATTISTFFKASELDEVLRASGCCVLLFERKVLKHDFAATLTEKLLTFALGRGVEYYDAPAVRKIVRDAQPGGYHFSSLVLGIVHSAPFQMRRSS